MLKRYKAPDGSHWLFDEGEQPKNYIEPDVQEAEADVQEAEAEQPKAKARTPRNKARTAKAK